MSKKLWFLVIAVGLMCGVVAAADDEQDFTVAWQEDFDDPKVAESARYFEFRTQKRLHPQLLIASIKDGVLTLGGHPLEGEVEFAAHLGWGNGMSSGAWTWQGMEWPGYDPKEFPIIDIRVRKSPYLRLENRLIAVFEQEGKTIWNDYGLSRKVEKEWTVFTFRLDPRSFEEQKKTPRRLIGVAIYVIANKKAYGLEVDWIRLRSYNEAEKFEARGISDALKQYRLPDWKQEMFLFGVYGGSDMSLQAGGLEGVYGDYTRNHLNLHLNTHQYSYYRYRGHLMAYGPVLDQPEAVKQFIPVTRKGLRAAEAAGIKLGLDMRGLAPDLIKHGRTFIRPAVEEIVKAFADEPALFGYSLEDEPSPSALWKVVGVKRMFEELDPKRVAYFVVSSPFSGKAFEPYATVRYFDCYPINDRYRDPWRVADKCRDYNKLSAEQKPLWILIQSCGHRPWWNKKWGDLIYPSVVELRLMTYLALANGAKGIMYYDYYQYLRKSLVDEFGNPEPLLGEVRALGEKIVPIGNLMMSARWTDSPGFEVETDQPSERGLAIGVLEERERGIHYMVVVNEDIEQQLSGRVKIGSKILDATEQAYDLYSLKPVSKKGTAQFPVGKLAPGDGRVYVLATPEEFEKIRTELFLQQAKEALRVMTPDISIAKRWKLDMTRVEALRSKAQDEIAAGKGEVASSRAQEAAQALKDLMAANETLAQCQQYLSAIRQQLGQLIPHMTVYYDEPNPKTAEFYQSYTGAGQKYSDLRAQLIAGQSDGLLDTVKAHKKYVDNLAKQILSKVEMTAAAQ